MASYPTAEEISKNYDFAGKTVLITGANTGIGKETARVLALRNAHVILGSRSVKKGEEAREDILKSLGQHKADAIEVMELDLSSLAKVRQFADRFAQRSSTQLHYLINNAGVLAAKNQTTEDGFELHFGVNHLAHFLLTLLLLPYLKASQPARIITVASDAHAFTSDVDPGDVNLTRFKGNFAPQYAYSVSKVYNILFSDELNRRLTGTGVTSSSLHPGLIVTEVLRDYPEEERLQKVENLSKNLNIPILSIPQGAATTVYATGDPSTAKGGEYFRNCTLGVRSAQAQDVELGKKLWAVSEELAHIHFN